MAMRGVLGHGARAIVVLVGLASVGACTIQFPTTGTGLGNIGDLPTGVYGADASADGNSETSTSSSTSSTAQTFSAVFSNASGANANTTAMTSTSFSGYYGAANSQTHLQALAGTMSDTHHARVIDIEWYEKPAVGKSYPLATRAQIFPSGPGKPPIAGKAWVTYAEQWITDTAVGQSWDSTGGTLTVDFVDGANVTVHIARATMEPTPAPWDAMAFSNADVHASGTFALDATGTGQTSGQIN